MDGEYHELRESAITGVEAVRLCLQPGDVAVFDGMLPHRSPQPLEQLASATLSQLQTLVQMVVSNATRTMPSSTHG